MHLYRSGRFVDVSGISGADSASDGRGSATADLDNDGDMDIVLRTQAALGEPRLLVYRNNVGSRANFLRVRLEGRESGRDAAGAVVRIRTGGDVVTRYRSLGSGFASQWDPRLLFGLGAADRVDAIEIDWPSGRKQRFVSFEAGLSLHFVEGEEAPRIIEERRFSLPEPLERKWNRVLVRPGQPLPPLRVTAGGGAERSLLEILPSDRPVVVNFWATWCKACRSEMPELQRTHASGGFAVIGVNVDAPEDRHEVPGFLRELGISYPVVYASAAEDVARALSPELPLPLTLWLGEGHLVIDVAVGGGPEGRRGLAPAADPSPPDHSAAPPSPDETRPAGETKP